MQTIHTIAQWTLDQLSEVIRPLSEDVYRRQSTVIPDSTVGMHTRHVCDHFRLLLVNVQAKESHAANGTNGTLEAIGSHDALGTEAQTLTVDFDSRERNNDMETCPAAALAAIHALQTELEKYEELPLETPVRLLAAICPTDEARSVFQSSFGRELWYCCIHACHHFASIKAICIEAGIPIPDDFGVAPSTLQSRSHQASCQVK